MRYSDLQASLPGIATNVLATLLKALVAAGVIKKSELPPPAASTVYELSDLGRSLAPVLVELGKWGMNFLPRHAFEPLDFLEALRTRLPLAKERANGVEEDYVFVIDDQTVAVRVAPDALEANDVAPAAPAVTITLDAAAFIDIALLGKTVAQAQAEGIVNVDGSVAAAERAFGLFRLPGTEPGTAAQAPGPALA